MPRSTPADCELESGGGAPGAALRKGGHDAVPEPGDWPRQNGPTEDVLALPCKQPGDLAAAGQRKSPLRQRGEGGNGAASPRSRPREQALSSSAAIRLNTEPGENSSSSCFGGSASCACNCS
mmetsp:Transcript_55802/g.173158  ORF Transcript_55802/g.173158 Transcript_55802/m.173158 type:complete len:122 (+) Transcript_55802:1-366(+)